MKSNKGSIALILTIGALVVITIATIASTFFVKKTQTVKTNAMVANGDDSGGASAGVDVGGGGGGGTGASAGVDVGGGGGGGTGASAGVDVGGGGGGGTGASAGVDVGGGGGGGNWWENIGSQVGGWIDDHVLVIGGAKNAVGLPSGENTYGQQPGSGTGVGGNLGTWIDQHVLGVGGTKDALGFPSGVNDQGQQPGSGTGFGGNLGNWIDNSIPVVGGLKNASGLPSGKNDFGQQPGSGTGFGGNLGTWIDQHIPAVGGFKDTVGLPSGVNDWGAQPGKGNLGSKIGDWIDRNLLVIGGLKDAFGLPSAARPGEKIAYAVPDPIMPIIPPEKPEPSKEPPVVKEPNAPDGNKPPAGNGGVPVVGIPKCTDRPCADDKRLLPANQLGCVRLLSYACNNINDKNQWNVIDDCTCKPIAGKTANDPINAACTRRNCVAGGGITVGSADADGDGKTCLSDYVWLQAAFNGVFGQDSVKKLKADFNKNKIIDEGDRVEWLTFYDKSKCGQTF